MELQSRISLEPELLLDILENMSTAVVALNSDSTYFFINIAALNMLGISNNFPDLKTLKSTVGNQSLGAHIKNVRDNNHSKMIRDFKFKNFEGDEKIVDCNISQAIIDNSNVTLIELSETGRLHSISLEQNLICLLYTSPSPRDS